MKISPIYIPIAIKIPLDSGVMPFWNRESLQYNSFTKNYILDKLKQISTWFVEKYNKDVPDQRELLEAWDSIPLKSKSVEIAGHTFNIDGLLKFTNVKPKELKIKGLEIEAPEYYYDKKFELGDEYECIVDYSENFNRRWRTKHVKNNHYLCDREIKHILVNKVPTGKLKEFLLDKHKGKLRFIKNAEKRILGGRYITVDSICYKNVLNLVMHPKSEWRKRIQEWQFVENQFKSLIIDESNCEESPEFLKYVAEQKELAKANRKKGVYKGSSLNKLEGDVTMSIIVPKEIGNGWKFVKKTFKINELYKNPKLTILFVEGDKANLDNKKAKALQLDNLVRSRWNVRLIGKNEYNKIKEIHNLKTFKEFMETKAFHRIATSLLFEKLTDQFDAIYGRNNEIIQQLLKPFHEDVQKLKEYSSKNGKYVKDNELLDSMIEIAKEYNLYDYSLWDIFKRVEEGIKKYDFVAMIEEPRSWSEENKKKINQLIAQMLLFRKKYYNAYDELEIIVKQPEVVAVTEEETILETENV